MSGYSKTVMDHFFNPRNAGELPDADGFGEDGTSGNGPSMRFWVNVNNNQIDDVTFKAYGCGAAIACCSMLTEMAKGQTITSALELTEEMLTAALGGLPPGKYHCPKMAITAFHRSVLNARAKKLS